MQTITRAIRLKLEVSRQNRYAADALIQTHRLVNEMVRYYENILLMIRQDDVQFATGIVKATDWTHDLIRKLEYNKAKNPEKAAKLLKDLYPFFVGSYIEGGSGSADEVRGYQGLLVQRDAKGGEYTTAVVLRLKKIFENGTNIEKEIAADPLINGPGVGRTARWITLFRDKDPEWKAAAERYLQTNEASIQMAVITAELRKLNALPLMPPYLEQFFNKSSLHNFERSAFALAVGHLNSWESWRHILQNKQQDLETSLHNLEDMPSINDTDLLDNIEKARAAVQPQCDLITGKEVRHWRFLSKITDKHERVERAKDLNSTILVELAQAEFDDANSVWWWVNKNKLIKSLRDAKKLPIFTHADYLEHPRSPMFSGTSNKNNPGYKLEQATRGGCLYVELPLFAHDKDRLVIERFRFKIAETDQLQNLVLSDDGSKQKLEYDTQNKIHRKCSFAGGGSLILSNRFIRDPMRRGKRWDGRQGSMAFFMLSIEVDKAVSASNIAPKSRVEIARYLSKSLVTRRKEKTSPICPGIRIMAVHLGVRTPATCSIFEITDKKSDDPRWSVDGWAFKHEQTFMLTLPEEPDKQTKREALAPIREIERELTNLSTLRQLVDARSVDARSSGLDASKKFLSPDTYKELRDTLDYPDWQRRAAQVHYEYADKVAQLIKDWRSKKSPIGGKSLWRVSYLERTRDVLRSWTRHARPGFALKYMRRETQGTIASKLLRRIQNLKRDRTKTVAAYIVEAAEGNVYRQGHWEHKYTPVDVIVLGDLSSYKLSDVQDIDENVRLAQWAHRAVAQEIENQAAARGIAIGKTIVSYSSIVHAFSGTPGVQCYLIGHNDVEEIKNSGHWLRKHVRDIKGTSQVITGDLIPVPGGRWLVTRDSTGKCRRIEVDINAAQNHAINYINGLAQPIKVSALYDTQGRLVQKELGKSLQGFLGGASAQFAPNRDGNHIAVALKVTKIELTNKKEVLFRDPSGTFFPSDVWVSAEKFWATVKKDICSKLYLTSQPN